MSIITVPKNSL